MVFHNFLKMSQGLLVSIVVVQRKYQKSQCEQPKSRIKYNIVVQKDKCKY